MIVNKINRLKWLKRHLEEINKHLNRIEEIDPYGDVIENFCEDKTERHTDRIIKFINEDLKKEV